jgi:Domain of unknown function (DUF6265)
MKSLSTVFWATLLVTFVFSSRVLAEPCSLLSLSWMAGNWHNVNTPARAQERWVIAPDNILMGSSWEFPSGKSGYAEIMTIRPGGDASGNGLAMILRHFDGGLNKAWEEREAPMVFTASRCGTNEAVFDGEGPHAGEHITYKRTGDQLLIIGDFLHQGKPDHEEWHMVRSGD